MMLDMMILVDAANKWHLLDKWFNFLWGIHSFSKL